jgi:hypothetical protein
MISIMINIPAQNFSKARTFKIIGWVFVIGYSKEYWSKMV